MYENKENIDIFKAWLLIHTKDYGEVIFNDNVMDLKYRNRRAKIIFHRNDIVEEKIFDEHNNLIFYLHYEFKHYPLAVQLFHSLIEVLMREEDNTLMKVLLCCSGGLTTNYFRIKMNNYLALSNAAYRVDAAAISDIAKINKKYDIILVAPQVRYRLEKLREIQKDSIVEAIEPEVFATYDCARLYDQIASLIGDKRNEQKR